MLLYVICVAIAVKTLHNTDSTGKRLCSPLRDSNEYFPKHMNFMQCFVLRCNRLKSKIQSQAHSEPTIFAPKFSYQ